MQVDTPPLPGEQSSSVAQSPNFLTFKEPKNRFQVINSARLCSLAGRYDNPIPTRFLAHTRLFKNSSTEVPFVPNQKKTGAYFLP